MPDSNRARVLQLAIESCLAGDVEAWPAEFVGDVSDWSPKFLVTSPEELTQITANPEDGQSDAKVQVDAMGGKELMEYRVSACAPDRSRSTVRRRSPTDASP